MKIRIKFTKTGVLKYIGHLDMMRYFQKVFRRSGMDIGFTKGFSPHPEISIALPLGLGVTSEAEYLDVTVNSCGHSQEMIELLNREQVEGVNILSFRQVPDGRRSNAMAIATASRYRITLSDDFAKAAGLTCKNLPQRLADFMAQPEIVIWRKTKHSEGEADIKPMILEARAVREPEMQAQVQDTHIQEMQVQEAQARVQEMQMQEAQARVQEMQMQEAQARIQDILMQDNQAREAQGQQKDAQSSGSLTPEADADASLEAHGSDLDDHRSAPEAHGSDLDDHRSAPEAHVSGLDDYRSATDDAPVMEVLLPAGSAGSLNPDTFMRAFTQYLGAEAGLCSWQIHRLELYTGDTAEPAALVSLDELGEDV